MQEVAYNLKERVRQELAFPAVVHFYSWLLQGAREDSSYLVHVHTHRARRASLMLCFSPPLQQESDAHRLRVGAGYASNGRHVNHYLVSFLGRIANAEDGLNLEPMLYQVRSSYATPTIKFLSNEGVSFGDARESAPSSYRQQRAKAICATHDSANATFVSVHRSSPVIIWFACCAQASMLRVFLSIMNDAAYLKADPAAARELLTFARRILRSMFDRMVPPAQASQAAPSDACAACIILLVTAKTLACPFPSLGPALACARDAVHPHDCVLHWQSCTAGPTLSHRP